MEFDQPRPSKQSHDSNLLLDGGNRISMECLLLLPLLLDVEISITSRYRGYIIDNTEPDHLVRRVD